MNKRMILGVMVGTAVFASVFASAASLGGLNSGSLGADDQTVASCDVNGVAVAYTVEYTATGTAGYKVKDLTVSGVNNACDNAAIEITLTGAGSAALSTVSGTVPTDAAATIFNKTAGSTTLAEAVTGVSVVINGAPTTATI